MARVLVIGGSGFIGYHLVQHLRQRGDEVTCLVRATSKTAHLDPLGVCLAQSDLTDAKGLAAAMPGHTIVYHVAGCVGAVDSRELFRVNEGGCRCVAEACAAQSEPPVLVYVSSLAAAGPSPGGRPRTEEDPLVQVSNYGRSKRAAELALQGFADRVPITVVRPAIVLGQRDTKGVAIFRSILRTWTHAVPGLAPKRFSIVHADDLAGAIVLAADRGKRIAPLNDGGPPPDTSGFYFLAGDEHPTYAELGRMARAAVGRPHALILPVPMPIVWAIAGCSELIGRLRGEPFPFNLDKAREAAAGSWTCSSRRAEEELGFRIAAPLAERLGQTIAWYREQGWL